MAVALVGALACFIYLTSSGHHGWYVSFIASALGVVLIMIFTAYVIYLQRWLIAVHRTPSAVFQFTEEEIISQTDIGSSKIKWAAIKNVWRFPEAWLLFISDWQYITLPTSALGEEIRHFILTQVQKNGGRVS